MWSFKSSIFCISVLFTFNAFADDHNGEGIFWEVQKNGITSYLLGTVHVEDLDLSALHPIVEERFHSSDVLLVEHNPYMKDRAGVDYGSFSLGDVAIINQVSPLARQRIERFVSGLPDQARDAYRGLFLSTVSPGVLLHTIDESLDAWRLGIYNRVREFKDSRPKGEIFDFRLIKNFVSTGKKIVELDHTQMLIESFDQQVDLSQLEEFLLSELPQTPLTSALNVTSFYDLHPEFKLQIANIERAKFQWRMSIPDIVKAYANGDIKTLYQHMTGQDSEMGLLINRVISLRHEHWVHELSDVLTQQSGFVVVGLNHVSANPYVNKDQTLVGLLKKKGFEVRSLNVRKDICDGHLL